MSLPPNGHIPFPISQKRARVEDEDEWENDVASTARILSHEKRVRRGPSESSSDHQPRHLVVHRVSCEGGDNHSRHKPASTFIDVPRLFAGDSKASALRGKGPLSSVEEYLEVHPEVCLVIYRSYSCNDYHVTVKDHFDRLQIPKLDMEMLSQLRPYFFSLRQDGELPTPIAEEMTIVSDELKEALTAVGDIYPEQAADWQDQCNLRAPYLHLYHRRSVLARHIHASLDAKRQSLIKVVLDYVQTSCEQEYAEADALFARGLVSQRHFQKLFGPNEVVVTTRDGQPLAYMSESCPDPDRFPVDLNCWSWTFDGFFQQEKTSIHVEWPYTTAQAISIRALKTYPLKYDTSGLEQRLKDRGRAFWSCRRRRYVSYESPNPTFEVQAVG